MKQKYDLIFSVGATCACSQALRYAGLQYLSMPFDWIGGPGLRGKADRICEEFDGWFGRDTFELITVPRYGHATYWRDRWGFTPIHDLNTSQPLEVQLPEVGEKYRRRADRLIGLIGSAKRVLVVQVDDPLFAVTQVEDVQYLHNALTRKWPQARFDVLLLQEDRATAIESRRVRSGKGWRLVSFAFRRYENSEFGETDYKLIGDWLATEFEVADYRTPSERRSEKFKRRRARYKQYGAESFMEYVWNHLQYKLFRHLQKDLSKRDVV